ncbi:hypothetical protein ACVWW1_006158 [Bradyrhizobium sp. JR3.5]
MKTSTSGASVGALDRRRMALTSGERSMVRLRNSSDRHTAIIEAASAATKG